MNNISPAVLSAVLKDAPDCKVICPRCHGLTRVHHKMNPDEESPVSTCSTCRGCGKILHPAILHAIRETARQVMERMKQRAYRTYDEEDADEDYDDRVIDWNDVQDIKKEFGL